MLNERLVKREAEIKDWLEKNSFKSVLEKADQVLNSLSRENIKKEFQNEIQRALEYSANNDEIKGVDFQWYYDGSEIGGAFAYGLEEFDTEGNLSNSDLGPEELSGIELEFEPGDIIEEDFAELPVYHAINAMVKDMIPFLESTELGNLSDVVEEVVTDYFQIWNYKIASEICEEQSESNVVQKLKERAPFWITMTRHERWPVGIMILN